MIRKRQNPIISILLMLFGLLLGYFFHSQFGGVFGGETTDTDVIVVDFGKVSRAEYLKFRDMQFNFEVIEQQNYRDLKIYGPEKVQSVPGRGDQIFNPY